MTAVNPSDALKAIETQYKGYRFRSRLEARWAVFFDTLGLTWRYEPEGFSLPSGRGYLPDFEILPLDPKFGFGVHGDHKRLFVEVKPSPESDWNKPEELVRHLNAQVVCVSGDPALALYPVIYRLSYPAQGPHPAEDFGLCGDYVELRFQYKDHHFFYEYADGFGLHADYGYRPLTGEDDRSWIVDSVDVTRAVKRARSARFEFGDQG